MQPTFLLIPDGITTDVTLIGGRNEFVVWDACILIELHQEAASFNVRYLPIRISRVGDWLAIGATTCAVPGGELERVFSLVPMVYSKNYQLGAWNATWSKRL